MAFFKKIFDRTRSKKYPIQYEAGDINKLFEDLEETYYKRIRTSEYAKNLERQEEEIKEYEHLQKEDLDKLVLLCSQYKSLQEKRQLLKGRLISANRGLSILSEYEEELPELICELSNVEKKVKECERDIFYLTEEKTELVQEREVLISGYDFLKKFSLFFAMAIALGMLTSFAALQILREEIWVYLGGFGCVLILFLAGLLYSKERIEKGLRDNEILQQKAVRYLNKTKIRYFHNFRYLQFQFEKLGVDSVAKLEMHYNRYLKNKHNEKDYAHFTQKLMDIEVAISDLFKQRGVQIESVEGLNEWINAPKKAQNLKNLSQQKQKIQEQLKALEAYEQELWREVFAFKEDPEYTRFVEDKILEYMQSTKQSIDKQLSPA